MRQRLAAVVLAVAVAAAGTLTAAPPAGADPRGHIRRDDRPHDRHIRRDDRRHDRHLRSHPPRHLVIPRVYYTPVYPTYVAPAPVWVPGYWTWSWVPQAQTSYVYVPGYFDGYGLWVSSRYEPRTVQGGYYQQVWVDGYWR